MPVLPNPRHESFAQALAKGKSADEAYALAGYKPHRGNASTLRANQNVLERVAHLQGRAAQRAEWTAADRLRMLGDIAKAAAKSDPRVAVSAIAEANKMQGSHAPAKVQHAGAGGGPIQHVDLTKMSDDDLDRLEAIFGPLAGAASDDDGEDQSGEGSATG